MLTKILIGVLALVGAAVLTLLIYLAVDDDWKELEAVFHPDARVVATVVPPTVVCPPTEGGAVAVIPPPPTISPEEIWRQCLAFRQDVTVKVNINMPVGWAILDTDLEVEGIPPSMIEVRKGAAPGELLITVKAPPIPETPPALEVN